MSIVLRRMLRGSALALLALWALPVAAAAGGTSEVAMGQLLKVLIGLVVVVVGILVLSRVLGRLQGIRSGGAAALGVVAVRPLGQRERLVVVEAGGRQLLLGVTSSQISLLMELERPLADSAVAHDGRTDAAMVPGWLSRVLGRESS